MSPEQVLGKTLDGRSDLFSVGVMLYEMVTGERPFEGQSLTTIMYKIVHEEPIAPRKLDSTIHPGLSAIVEKALAKAPEGRFQSGSELAAALENYKQLSFPVALTGNERTAALPALPETAALTQPNIPSAAIALRTQSIPTVEHPPAVILPEKKRRFSPFLLGCFGVVALGILSLTLITVVALVKDRGKRPSFTINDQGVTVNPNGGESAAPPNPQPPAVGALGTNAGVVEHSPPKPAQTKATLKLNSTPPGAEVVLDGKPTGKSTPTSITIERGQHAIALRMAGFPEAAAKFKVSGGEEFEFSPELTPAVPGMGGVNIPKVEVPDLPAMVPDFSQLQQLRRNGALSEQQRAEIKLWEKWGAMQRVGELSILVNSRPAGASIFIDGKDTGTKTPEVIRSSAGTYTVRLQIAGYEPFEREVTVGANRGPAMINARLAAKQP
jgi:hypothetical protein